MSELKKKILEDDVLNITRSGKHYKPSFLEKDHLGRNEEEGSKPVGLNEKEEKQEEDRVLTQLKKTQAHTSFWGVLMAFHKHRNALLDALNGKEVPIETTPQEILSLVEVEAPSYPSLTFLDEELPPKGATCTRTFANHYQMHLCHLKTIVEFHVMDITPNYNLLLGRAWLYPIGAIPSTLHQKMKISWKGRIVVVLGDGEILAPVCGLEGRDNKL
ncbi:hypothetical protein SO802_007871 [Lithocarpus litseifolius]|uniref:Uncharacterized protein n=1 Tax=Lithocarpus litseifolius TaxID=425828 RepID=A0AAW2DT69_9ROSI